MAGPKVIKVIYDVNRSEIQGAAQDWAAVAKNVGVTEQRAERLAGEFKKETGQIEALKTREKELQAIRTKSHDPNQIKKINKELDESNKKLSDLSKTSEKTGGGLKGLIGGLAQFAPAIGVGAVAALGKEAIGAAIEFEQLSVSFETFLGSAEKAQSTIAELEAFSAATPFTSEEVLNAGRSLLAFGESADTVTDKLRMIGDISAGTGKDFGELATLFGKARVSGVIMAEDINQFTEAGIPIIDEFAKILGVSTSEVKKMGSQGAITFDTLQQAFTNMTSEGGKFAGLTEKLSQTTGGLLSTLQSNFQILLRDIGTALLPVVQVLIGVVTEGFDQIKSAIAPVIDGFKSLANSFGLAGEKGSMVGSVVKVIATAFKIMSLPVTLTWKAVGFLTEKLSEFIDNSPRLKAVIGSIADSLGAVIDAISGVIDWFDNLLSVASDRVSTVTLLTQRLSAAGLTVQAAMKQMNSTLKKEFGATDQQIKEFSQSFDFELLRNAGTIEEATAIIKDEYSKWAAATQPAITAQKALKGEIEPLPGSIAAMQAEMKKLNDEFSKVTTFEERFELAEKIKALKIEIDRVTDPIGFMIDGLEKAGPAIEKAQQSLRAGLSQDFSQINTTADEFSSRMDGLEDDLIAVSDEAERLRMELEAAFSAEKLQNFVNGAGAVFNQALQMSSAIGQLWDAQTAAQLQGIEERKQKEISATNATGAAKEAIEKRYNDQTRKIQKESAERSKKLAIFQAIINGAQAVLAALDDAPVPYNFVLAALNAAAAAVQIQAIRSQPIPFAKGGPVTGGTPNKDSVSAVLMPGEFVMRKDTVNKYRPLIEAMHNDKLGDLLINGAFNDGNMVRAINKGTKRNGAIQRGINRTNELLSAMLDNQAAYRRPSLRRGY